MLGVIGSTLKRKAEGEHKRHCRDNWAEKVSLTEAPLCAIFSRGRVEQPAGAVSLSWTDCVHFFLLIHSLMLMSASVFNIQSFGGGRFKFHDQDRLIPVCYTAEWIIRENCLVLNQRFWFMHNYALQMFIFTMFIWTRTCLIGRDHKAEGVKNILLLLRSPESRPNSWILVFAYLHKICFAHKKWWNITQ